jgi:hypothetical protein
MKRILLALAVFAAMGGTAHAEHGTADFVRDGHVLIGDNAGYVAIATEAAIGCEPDAPWQGIDSVLVELPAGSAGHTARLDWAADAITDFDVYFLDAECQLLSDESMVTGDAPEVGIVPEGAVWAEVDLFLGADADFTLTVEDVLPAA